MKPCLPVVCMDYYILIERFASDPWRDPGKLIEFRKCFMHENRSKAFWSKTKQNHKRIYKGTSDWLVIGYTTQKPFKIVCKDPWFVHQRIITFKIWNKTWLSFSHSFWIACLVRMESSHATLKQNSFDKDKNNSIFLFRKSDFSWIPRTCTKHGLEW